MFINFVALMLINMVAGLVVLAHFVYFGLDAEDRRRWVPAFAMVGLVALLTGLRMVWTWPLPGAHNAAFGEPYVLFGAAFLGAALAMWFDWDLLPVALYASVSGLVGVLVGVRILQLGMTREPLASMLGFVLTGLAGLCATPAYLWRRHRIIRILGALAVLGAAAVWAITGYGSVWSHIEGFANWVPATMR